MGTWRPSSLQYRQTHPFRQRWGHRRCEVGGEPRRQNSRLGQYSNTKKRRRSESLLATSKRSNVSYNDAAARTRHRQCPPDVGPRRLPAAPPPIAPSLPPHQHRLGHAVVRARGCRLPGCHRTAQGAVTATAAGAGPGAPYPMPGVTKTLGAQASLLLAAARGKTD